MSYFIIFTFNLSNFSSDDYKEALEELEKIGLSHQSTSNQESTITLQTKTTAGKFNGNNPNEVRKELDVKIKKAFQKRRFSYEIFVSIGGNWSWNFSRTKFSINNYNF